MGTKGIHIGRVIENRQVCREHFLLRVAVPGFAESVPGQFVQVLCRQDQGGVPQLRKPFSIGGRERLSAGDNVIDILHRVVGPGTAYLSRLRVGDDVNLLGPLGNGFPMPAHDQRAVMVAGGVGIPPMIYLASQLSPRQASNAIAFCGATTGDLLAMRIQPGADCGIPGMWAAEFAQHGVATAITTDDGTLGKRGLVTEAFAEFLKSAGQNVVVYTCGPEGMMKRVAEICQQYGVHCHVAVERTMACGLGTCQSCCIRVRDETKTEGWKYALSCTEGPVFQGGSGGVLLW